ncbi:MAG: DAK2 domain-containing protein [Cellulosilyticaceae bacterium]
MKLKSINAKMLQEMIVAGAKLLDEQKEAINELNVFPVPDGDTGTNMSLTMLAAAREVEGVEEISIKAIGSAAASGSLRGARGNSGVILSQLIRGFAKGLTEDEIDTLTLANAFQSGVDTAYKAVMKPKEGTILTVAREVATKAMQLSMEVTDLAEFAEKVLSHGYEVLNKTPDMLPVLKEAGVVDAGGQGLLSILEGAAKVITGDIKIDIKKPMNKPNAQAFSALLNFNTEDITFGYCTEFIVQRNLELDYDEEETKNYLDTLGDSIVVVSDEEYIKVHVHTDHPGLAIEKALAFGQLINIKIENMREQHSTVLAEGVEAQAPERPKQDIAFVSIVTGSGIADIMHSLSVTEVIEGGQTMNPSTEDICDAIKRANAKQVIILPNNKNIILAAEQAASIVEDCKVYVVPTKTIPQGITAMVTYDNSTDAEAVVSMMNESIKMVQTAQITIAVRDTTIDGQQITEGEYLGILESDIVVHQPELKETFKQLLNKLNEDSEIITIYYGEEISEDLAMEYLEIAQEQFQDAEVEIHCGGQPVYYFMVSAE